MKNENENDIEPAPGFTPRQGQFLAFIHNYILMNGRPPAETDLRRYFGTSPPSIHQMLVTLEARGLIRRTPGAARSTRLLVPPGRLPRLGEADPAAGGGGTTKAGSNPFPGRWRITGMEAWENDYIDEEVDAYLRFDPKHSGEFQFASVTGSIDYRLAERDGRPAVEWSWSGNDETDEVSGRGWAVLRGDGILVGRFFIHDGDDSAFAASKADEPKRRR